MMVNFAKYLKKVGLLHLLCIDERPREEAVVDGPHVPGAIYGIIDALKVLLGHSEDRAWRMAHDAGLPMDCHTDAHHELDPGLGCGYGAKVQSDPKSVGAPKSVPAGDRMKRAKQFGGKILHYLGDHKATAAVIVNRDGYTIDQAAAWRDGNPVFVCDLWAVRRYAKMLGIDANKLAAQVELEFRYTVKTLADITEVLVID